MKKTLIFTLVVMAMLLCPTTIIKAADTGTPDLQITADNITITPASLKEGLTATFKAKVENKGTATAKKVKVRFYIDEKKIGEKTISSISKSKTYTSSLTYKIPNGSIGEHKLVVVVGDQDPVFKVKLELSEGVVVEEKENKMQAEKSFTVAPAYSDLSVAAGDLKISPANFKGGDKVSLIATVRNLASDSAKNVKISFIFAGVNVYSKTITTISKNSKNVVTYKYTLPVSLKGATTFQVVADPEDKIRELDEKNNEASINVTVNPAQIDLFIDTFKTSNAKPKAGQNVSIQTKVKNGGNTNATNVKLNIYLGDNHGTPNFTYNIPKINKNAVISKSFVWKIPNNIPGSNYQIRAEVDPSNTIQETNEINNTKIYLLNLTAPDLTIARGQYAEPRFVYPGLNNAMWVKVSNNNVLAAANTKVGLYYYLPGQADNPVKIGEENLGTINKKASKEVFLAGKIPSTISLGTTIGFFAKVDNNGVIPESNEDNNTLLYQIPVIEQPRQLACPCLHISVSDENGSPLNGAIVKINNGTSDEIKTTGTDSWYSSSGNVIFENRPSSATYMVTISMPNYRTVSDNISYKTMDPDSHYRSYMLDKKALVSGTVKNAAGQVLPWTYVRIEGLGLEDITDAQGKYGFLLNGGTYKFRFLREGYNRAVESNYVVAPLSSQTLDKTMTPGTIAYFSGRVTDDEGNGLANTDIHVNSTMLGTTASDGRFNLNITAGDNKKFTFKKPSFINTELTENIVAGNEYNYDLVMYKPSTDNHVERGTNIVSWHQHEGTPANAFFIPEYNVDVWWGLGRVKMGLDYNKSDSQTTLNKLVVNVKGNEWECNKVEGEGEIETSAIDIPITIAAGSCSNKQTQMDVYKIAIESDGQEVWSEPGFWSSASDPMNSNTRVFTLNNVAVNWNNNLKVKMWVRVQKKAVVGTDGDGSGALYGYHMDKKLITWYPQKPPTTKISTSWGQIGGYFLGILDNPVNAVTGFMDVFTVDRFEQYTMEEVLPQNFPGYPSQY